MVGLITLLRPADSTPTPRIEFAFSLFRLPHSGRPREHCCPESPPAAARERAGGGEKQAYPPLYRDLFVPSRSRRPWSLHVEIDRGTWKLDVEIDRGRIGDQ
jgi:hypothetical protein